MTHTDYAAEARSASATAASFTRRAEREAGQAASAYVHASRYLRSAAQLAECPGSWRTWLNPATEEAKADSWTRTGDVYLRATFHSTGQAEFYRDLAARYRELRDRRAASLAS